MLILFGVITIAGVHCGHLIHSCVYLRETLNKFIFLDF